MAVTHNSYGINEKICSSNRNGLRRVCSIARLNAVLNNFIMLSQLPSWRGAYEGMFMQFILNFRKELTNSENPNTFGNLSDVARNVEALSE